jgi:MFS family permease
MRPVASGTRCDDVCMNHAANSNPAPTNALRTLSWSNLAAQSAEQISLAAVPIVAVIALNAGPGEIGALSTAQTLPFLLLSIPAGVLADRVSRRGLMASAEGLRVASLVAILILAPFHWASGSSVRYRPITSGCGRPRPGRPLPEGVHVASTKLSWDLLARARSRQRARSESHEALRLRA